MVEQSDAWEMRFRQSGWRWAAALAMVPVVATNIWALNAIIRNEVNGFLVEPKRADELALVIEKVLADPRHAESIARNAYEQARAAYSIDRMAQEMETVYREIARS